MSESPHQPTEHALIAAGDAGRRLDNFLLGRVGVPRQAVYRWIRTGQVRVNGARVRAHHRLVAGDRVRVPPHQEHTPRVDAAALPAIALPLLYEDDALLIVNKPAGLAVHGGSKLAFGLIDVLRASRPDDEHLELAHRLDRGTSGCLVVARTPAALAALHQQFRSRRVTKHYACLCAGHWADGAQEVTRPLAVRKHHARTRKTTLADDGQTARTRFTLTEQLPAHCLLAAEITTGRTHQIRVHAQSLGYPVVGDDRYGERTVNRAAQAAGFRRLFLHAEAVAFAHPLRDTAVDVTAPLPEDCEEFLGQLRQPAPSAKPAP